MSTNIQIKICPILECGKPLHTYKDSTGQDKHATYCDYHTKGGYLSNGESFTQYQIIEEDFIHYLKFVPLSEEHFKVSSPKLRDIIIRSCVEIEIFLKEWAKEECADPNCELLVAYNDTTKWGKIGDINWDMSVYSYFSKFFNQNLPIEVAPLKMEIHPFENWKKSQVPFWWSAYNKIKHNGYKHKEQANLKNALYSLAALFHLHCTHKYSLMYLQDLMPLSIYQDFYYESLSVYSQDVTTPIDTKRYLFKAIASNTEKPIEIVTKKDLNNYDIEEKYWDDDGL